MGSVQMNTVYSYGGIYKFSIISKTTTILTYGRNDGTLIDCIGTYQDSSNSIYNFYSAQSTSANQMFLVVADLNTETITSF